MTAKCMVERDMPERADREENAKTLLRAEMAGRGTTCAQLVEKLAVIGVEDNEWSFAQLDRPGGNLWRGSCCNAERL